MNSCKVYGVLVGNAFQMPTNTYLYSHIGYFQEEMRYFIFILPIKKGQSETVCWGQVTNQNGHHQDYSSFMNFPDIKKCQVIYHFLLLRWLHFSTIAITTTHLLFISFRSDTYPIKIVGYPLQRHGTSGLPSISSTSSSMKPPGGQ